MAWFGRGRSDERETETLISEARRLREYSQFQTPEAGRQFVLDLLTEVCLEADLCLTAPVAQHLGYIAQELFAAEVFAFDSENVPSVLETLEAGVLLRARLRDVIKVLNHEAHYLDLWRTKLKIILLGIIEALPVNALTDPDLDGSVPYESSLRPETPLYALMDDVSDLLRRLIGTFFDLDVAETPLFSDMRRQFEGRICVASGVAWEDRHDSKRPYLMPGDKPNIPVAELTALYTNETLFADFFATPVPIPIPPDVRFEHTHILGGTGHGKTQLLQYLIMDDLSRALRENVSLVVIDPDGTLIRTIAQTSFFRTDRLADRVIVIDPTDTDCPVGLNLFDVSYVDGGDARSRETIENNTIELFEYFFDALLGSELTGRQSTLFRYLGLLLMQIPGGNIHTLRELMEDGRQYRPYMDKLEGSARTFFATRFFDKSLAATKTQVLSRLWGVLSNRSLDRVFSARNNSVNLDQALLDGKIVFVHTSKESLGEEGSAVFARMIVALLGQSLIRRAATPPRLRTPTYIYIDEAEGVVDETLVRLLAQVRKYRGAITLAHQHLDQLPASARAGVLANTSIKLAGGISAKDASGLAPEYRTTADFILGMKKGPDESCFALFARNITPTAMSFAVPLGFAESFDRLSPWEYADLLARSRSRYGMRPDDPAPIADEIEADDDAPEVEVAATNEPIQTKSPPLASPTATPRTPAPPSTSEPIVRKEGGGGARHREIQLAIKELGEAVGFRASLEEVILDGEGRVDVILRKDDLTICCEVSVTTTKEHELLNVQKCLRFGADLVWTVAHMERHRVSLARFITPKLTETENAKLSYLTADQLEAALLGFAATVEQEDKVVKGYKVRSKQVQASLREYVSKSFDLHE